MAFIKRNWILVVRPVLARPLPTLLVVVAVTAGVAIGLAVERTSRRATAANAAAVAALVGKAALVADGAVAQTSAAELVDEVVGLRYAIPRVAARAVVRAPAAARSTVDVLGVLWGLEAIARTWPIRATLGEPRDVLDDEHAAIVSARFAERAGLGVGSSFVLDTPHRGDVDFRVVAILTFAGAAAAADDVVLVRLDTAQACWGRVGVVDRLALLVDPGADEAVVGRDVERVLGPGVRVRGVATERARLERAGAAFRTTWGLLAALTWGACIVVVAVGGLLRVAGREPVLRTLRRLGATRVQLATAVGVEVLGAALVGSALGVVVGAWLAAQLAPAVAASATWFLDRPVGATPPLPPGDDSAVLAFGLGVGAAVAGVVWPVRRAAAAGAGAAAGASSSRSPRWGRGVVVGLACSAWVVVSAALHWSRDRDAVRVLNAAAAIAACASFAPPLAIGSARAARRAFGAGLARSAVLLAGLARGSARTRALAPVAAVGVGIVALLAGLQHAFERAADDVVRRTAAGSDLVVATVDRGGGASSPFGSADRSARLDAALGARLGRIAGVERVVAVRDAVSRAGRFGEDASRDGATGVGAGEVESSRVDRILLVLRDEDGATPRSVSAVRAAVRDAVQRADVVVLDVAAYRRECRAALAPSFRLLELVQVAIGGAVLLVLAALAALASADRHRIRVSMRRLGATPRVTAWLGAADAAWVASAGAVAGLAVATLVVGPAWARWTLDDVLGWSVAWRSVPWSIAGSCLAGAALAAGGGAVAATGLTAGSASRSPLPASPPRS